MMSEDIKACPYCGSKDTKVSGWLGGSFGRCNSCGTTGPDADNESDAILLWNAAANQLAAKNAEIAEHRNHVAKIMQRENNMMKHNEKLRAEIARLTVAWRTAETGYTNMRNERDEARRVARRLYATNDELIRTFVCNPIATWREVYENSEQNGTTGVTQPSTDGN
jgi:hypothetical protein